MKLIKDPGVMRLESGYDYLAFFSSALYAGAAVCCIIASAIVGPYWQLLLFAAAINAGLACLFFLMNRAYTLTIHKNKDTVTLSSVSPLWLFRKTVIKSLTDALELHTVRVPGLSGVGMGASDTSVLFSISFADKSTIGFEAYRPKAIEKTPCFTFKGIRSTLKTQEQDIYAPELAKYMDISLTRDTS